MSRILYDTLGVMRSPVLDTETAKLYGVGWDLDLVQMRRTSPLYVQVNAFYTPHMQYGLTHYGGAYSMRGVTLNPCVVLAYVRSEATAIFRNRMLDKGELLVVTDRNEIDLTVSDRNTVFNLVVEEDLFYRAFLEYFGYPFERVVKTKRMRIAPGKEAHFELFIVRHMQAALRGEIDPANPVVREGLERAVLETLFSYVALDTPMPRYAPSVAAEARRLLHDALEEDVKMKDVVSRLGVSQRTLEYAFKKAYGTTPKAYLQLLRLYRIRRLLLEADPQHTRVSDIALRHGFYHLGHFSGEYKRTFGEMPSETLRRTLRFSDMT